MATRPRSSPPDWRTADCRPIGFRGCSDRGTFRIEKPLILVRAAGRQGRIQLVIDGFEKIRAPIYGGLSIAVKAETPAWYTIDVTMWQGHRAYLEMIDGAALDYTGGPTRYAPGDGYLAVDEIRFADTKPHGKDSGPGRGFGRTVLDLGRCAAPCGRIRGTPS